MIILLHFKSYFQVSWRFKLNMFVMLVFNYTLEISITSENILLSLDVTFTTSYL